mmetsp:Transcript_21521/g.30147  ORF Transcript_21521/g.30147 Transcript_21521/m.30147 type:complete len:104 (-) Transcript_21521:16-327(-)
MENLYVGYIVQQTGKMSKLNSSTLLLFFRFSNYDSSALKLTLPASVLHEWFGVLSIALLLILFVLQTKYKTFTQIYGLPYSNLQNHEDDVAQDCLELHSVRDV